MKNLLAFTTFLAVGFLLGSRRARKAGPIDQLFVEIKADTRQAVEALKTLQAQAEKTAHVVTSVTIKGDDLVTTLRRHNYQAIRHEGFPRPPVTSLNDVLQPAARPPRPLEHGRATGQTTRLVDSAIQTLFATGEVVVRDHVDRSANHRLAYELVVARLQLEHRRERFVFDDRKLTVLLPKFCKA